MRLASRLVVGAIAGFVGTMAMTGAMQRLHRGLPDKERYPLTPREIVDSTTRLEDETARDVTLATHFAYGAACGALIAAANERPTDATGAGAGLMVWLASYMGWIPAARILKPATRHPARRNLLMIIVHLVWGAATASAIRELGKARETIFAPGPDLDSPDTQDSASLKRRPSAD